MENITNTAPIKHEAHSHTEEERRLDLIEVELERELKRCRELVEAEKEASLFQEDASINSEDFNKRGELYRLAFEVAPRARREDLIRLFDWIQPKPGEKAVDVAAGTGMFSLPLARITQARLYAVDPSVVQLRNLEKKQGELDIKTIVGSLAEPETIQMMSEALGEIDIVTSYGGMHHVLDKEENGVVVNKQHEMFKNIGRLLKKGGRCVAGDVGAGSALARHFEGSVKEHCLTSHTEKWLSKERFEKELLEGTGLQLIRAEEVPVKWHFRSERELALFMKGLHAYDMSNEAVLDDLRTYLGYEKVGEEYVLNWPMLFFHLEKS